MTEPKGRSNNKACRPRSARLGYPSSKQYIAAGRQVYQTFTVGGGRQPVAHPSVTTEDGKGEDVTRLSQRYGPDPVSRLFRVNTQP